MLDNLLGFLNNTRLDVNLTGGVAVYDTNYVPFGLDLDEKGSEGFKFIGKHRDPTGFYYIGARYYGPETGRFITEDPVKGGLINPHPLKQTGS